MDNSQNIWVDGSLRNGEWFCSVYDDIRERFPRYRIAIFYVYASEPVAKSIYSLFSAENLQCSRTLMGWVGAPRRCSLRGQQPAASTYADGRLS